ncbi:AI-2E family transporter [Geodermatophilus chilensis]|uniref:AI-2E family transporter n=1 Tax=Geodermatophilus chilensis TaxID=2035835 RepID=UPI0013000BF6|nr:AI-2E family transporter [Geodermatophilus chilensis]
MSRHTVEAVLCERSPSRPATPPWALRVLTTSGAVLALAATGWLLFWFLLRVPLLTVTIAVALLLTALLEPVARWLRRCRLPPALAAVLSVLLLVGTLSGVGFLLGFRAAAKLRDLTRPLAAGIDRIRVWLVEGPLHVDPQQVTDVRNAVVNQVYEVAPDPTAAARMALHLLAAVVLVIFLLFFLLKDGAGMWTWLLERVPHRRRGQVDGAGRCAWTALARYVRGAVVVALIDAVGIGAALFVLDVPLWVSLTLLTFLSAFVPLFGATVSGAVAVLVTLVTNGPSDAVIVLVVVLVVQQVEGNVLQPLIVGHAVRVHPAAVLVAVTAGTLLWGLAGALLAVPLMAVTYRIAEYVRQHPAPPAGQPRPWPPMSPDGPGAAPAGGARPAPGTR